MNYKGVVKSVEGGLVTIGVYTDLGIDEMVVNQDDLDIDLFSGEAVTVKIVDTTVMVTRLDNAQTTFEGGDNESN